MALILQTSRCKERIRRRTKKKKESEDEQGRARGEAESGCRGLYRVHVCSGSGTEVKVGVGEWPKTATARSRVGSKPTTVCIQRQCIYNNNKERNKIQSRAREVKEKDKKRQAEKWRLFEGNVNPSFSFRLKHRWVEWRLS
jgi:hypothetical protein